MNTIEEARDNGLFAGTPECQKDLTGEFVSQAKNIAKGVNCDKLLTIAHETGQMKTTTSAARACWLFLRNRGYAAAGLLLWQGDHAWAGGFEFKAEEGWTTIRYIELDPANPLEEDLELERDSDFHGDNEPDGPDSEMDRLLDASREEGTPQ